MLLAKGSLYERSLVVSFSLILFSLVVNAIILTLSNSTGRQICDHKQFPTDAA